MTRLRVFNTHLLSGLRPPNGYLDILVGIFGIYREAMWVPSDHQVYEPTMGYKNQHSDSKRSKIDDIMYIICKYNIYLYSLYITLKTQYIVIYNYGETNHFVP